jgi:hypothetical protein
MVAHVDVRPHWVKDFILGYRSLKQIVGFTWVIWFTVAVRMDPCDYLWD